MQLRPYQIDCLDRSLESYRNGINRQLAVLATGLGKCLGKGTPVLMFDGTILPVEEIRVGDLLMGPDSSPRLVKSLARGREEMFRVIPVKGDEYTVNRSHILSLKMTSRGTQYPCYFGKRVDISVDEYLKKSPTFKHMAKGWRVPVDFQPHTEPLYLDPYFLGLWLGDGTSSCPAITSADGEIVRYIEAFASVMDLRINKRVQPGNKSSVYSFGAKSHGYGINPVRNALVYYNLKDNKHIPHRFKTGSKKERLAVLAGIIDTDGHYADKGFQLTLKSERLLDDVVFVARSLGFSAYKSVRLKKSQNGTEGTYYHCNINGPVEEVPCRVERKKATPRLQKKDHLVTGISVKSVGDGEYFGFEIEGPDRLFLLGDFTVTHNTAIASSLHSHHGMGRKCLFLVHMETLAVQAANAMLKWNPTLRTGVEMAGSYVDFDGLYPPTFIVASVPTLGRKGSDRIKRFDPADFDCIIQDEAHISIADSFKRVYGHFGLLEPNPNGPLFLGITATPNRSDGKGLRELFDMIVFDMGIKKGIADGWLCDIRGLRVDGKAKLDNVKIRAGEFAQDELSKEVNTPSRNAIIVKEWYKHAYDRRTICFTVDIQHALDLAAAFTAHGTVAKAVWGDDPERHEKIRGHKSGEYPVICCAQLLGIGYDDPLITCIVLSAPRKSFVRYAQEVGRGTRIADGKEDLLVIDVGDNTSRHDLCSVSSLLGLPKNLDLKGESYKKAKTQLDRMAAEFPTANVQDIKQLDDLKSIAENFKFFTVSYPPEISKLSELAWRKSTEGYILAVNRDLVTVTQDLRGDYVVRGRIGDKVAEISAQNLPGAFNAADKFILDSGGVKAYLVRDARWKQDSPSPNQMNYARLLARRVLAKNKMTIDLGIATTKGKMASAIDSMILMLK